MMKIAVLGANGRSGKVFVEKALSQGNEVFAGVYKNNNLTPNPNLKILICNATNKKDITNLVKNADVVVSLIGHVKNSPKDTQTIAIKNIIDSISPKTRVISLTGTGVRVTGDKISFIDRVLNFSIKIIDPDRIKDGVNHLKELRTSNVDFTVIRVLKLTNSKPQKFSFSEGGPAKIFVSRHEVAEGILRAIDSSIYNKKTPIISRYKNAR